MFNLDFETDDLQFPCHPRHQEKAQEIKTALRNLGLKSHFLVFSSGTTTSELKGYALSRDALLTNAMAVNEHFNLNSEDIWGLSLPYYHVGGLSVLARAHVLNSKVIDLGLWEPKSWLSKLNVEKITVTSVVPTQIYDIVQMKLKAPLTLKWLIVGGDHLSLDLEKLALDLGWPIIRTFGMTEVCSQLASSTQPRNSALKILPIHQVKVDESGLLTVRGPCLFTLVFRLKEKLEVTSANELCNEQGFFVTSDLAQIKGDIITPLGRVDDQIKVAGKLVSVISLREKLYSFALANNCYGKVELKVQDDQRLGKVLVLLHLPGVLNIDPLLFSPLRFEIREVPSFERTDLGKLKK